MRKRGMIVLSLMIALIIMLVPVASLRARAEEDAKISEHPVLRMFGGLF